MIVCLHPHATSFMSSQSSTRQGLSTASPPFPLDMIGSPHWPCLLSPQASMAERPQQPFRLSESVILPWAQFCRGKKWTTIGMNKWVSRTLVQLRCSWRFACSTFFSQTSQCTFGESPCICTTLLRTPGQEVHWQLSLKVFTTLRGNSLDLKHEGWQVGSLKLSETAMRAKWMSLCWTSDWGGLKIQCGGGTKGGHERVQLVASTEPPE